MHVIVAGTARSGKTTLAIMMNKHGFTHYKMDSIKRAVFDTLKLKSDGWEDVSPIMCNIINRIIKDNRTDTNYKVEKYLIDTPFLYPKDIEKIDTKDVLVIFIGYAHISVDEEIKLIRENDKEHYWTTKIDDETMRRWTIENIEYSKELERECKRLGFKYFDTSYDRENVLKEAEKYILEKENSSFGE